MDPAARAREAVLQTQSASRDGMVLDSSVINSSDFRIYCFKILPCTRRYGHDWTACPFCHPGEKATRRCPQKHAYMPLACPDVKKTGECPRKEACTYAHNVFEYWCHPLRFRTQLCSYGADCKRSICFFAHSYNELRVVDQSLLQELERQMDLLGDGAGFGFPPSSKRSAREERHGSAPAGGSDAFSPSAGHGTGLTPRKGSAEGAASRQTTAMSDARAAVERAVPAPVLPDTLGQVAAVKLVPRSSGTSADGHAADTAAPGDGTGTPPAGVSAGSDAGPGSNSLSSPEPSLAAQQVLQLQTALHQQRSQQQQQQQQRGNTIQYSHDKVVAAAGILGIEASYLGQILANAPPPPPVIKPQPGVQEAMQSLLQQLTQQTAAQNGAAGGASSGSSYNTGWQSASSGSRTTVQMSADATAQAQGQLAMLLNVANDSVGGGRVGSGLRNFSAVSEPLQHPLPSLRANEEQMAATLKVLMELNANKRPAAAPGPASRNSVANSMAMQAAVQQLQELSSLAGPQAVGNGGVSMQAMVQQLQDQLSSRLSQLAPPEPEPEPQPSGLAAALASIQQSIDTARLTQALESLAASASVQLPPPPPAAPAADANMLTALLSQFSVGQPGISPQGSVSYGQAGLQQSFAMPSISELPDMGAFGGANAAAIAAAAAAQAAMAGPQSSDRLFTTPSGTRQMPVGTVTSGMAGGAGIFGSPPAATSGLSDRAAAAAAQQQQQQHFKNSTSPVDVLSMQSQRSGQVGSGSDSVLDSDRSVSPQPPQSKTNPPTAEASGSLEEEDMPAQPRLFGAISDLNAGSVDAGARSTSPIGAPSSLAAAAAAAAAGGHPLRGSPSLRPSAVSFKPGGTSSPLGLTMSSPLLGLPDVSGAFAAARAALGGGTSGDGAVSSIRASFENQLFGNLGAGGLGSSSGAQTSAALAASALASSLRAQAAASPAVREQGSAALKGLKIEGSGVLMGTASEEEMLAAVALLTPAGTGSFNAHDFPPEL